MMLASIGVVTDQRNKIKPHHTMNRNNHSFLFSVCLVCTALLSQCCQGANSDQDAYDEIKKARELAKPWLMKNLQVGSVTLPFSPVSIIVTFLVIINLINVFINPQWAEASHILVKDTSSNAKKMMIEMKKDIGDDLKRFGEFASRFSSCPSKTNKGDLGRFKSGEMAPPFDKAVFDPKTPIGTTIGPVQTSFGYHLIYIRDRSKL